MTDPTTATGLRAAAGRQFLLALRRYTFHSPVRAGKLRLARFDPELLLPFRSRR